MSIIPKQPFISIIMPIRNEAAFIKRSLGSLQLQDYAHDHMEILVVDGLSTDGTRKILEDIAYTSDKPSIKIIDNPHKIMPSGFNLAVAKSKGDVILMVGGHCELAKDYVTQCVHKMSLVGADCVGGPMKTVAATPIAKSIALAQSSPFGVGGVAFRTQKDFSGYVDTVAFGAYRRDVFERIGLLDEELVRNQDDEFNFRLTQAGGKIWLDADIHSTYYSRATLRKLWQQYFQYGLYKVRVIQKRGAVPSWRHLIPAFFLLCCMGGTALSVLTGSWLWAALVVFPYILAMAVASIVTAGKKIQYLLYLPIAFGILHIAYGTGFLWGLWRWRAYGFPKLNLAGKIQ